MLFKDFKDGNHSYGVISLNYFAAETVEVCDFVMMSTSDHTADDYLRQPTFAVVSTFYQKTSRRKDRTQLIKVNY